jgi:glucokinase
VDRSGGHHGSGHPIAADIATTRAGEVGAHLIPNDPIPVLEIGGTHVTAVLVTSNPWDLVHETLSTARLNADGTSAEVLDELAAAANGLQVRRRSDWVVAVPGPFDYRRGVGLFRDVGKFDNLYGVDVRRGLMMRIRPGPTAVRFLNDADAFGVGEYAAGAARGHDRAVCITLGTGVGSAFLDRGRPVNSGPTVPPDGSIHLLVHEGQPLEETVSRRAIRAAYAAAAGGSLDNVAPDVHAIAERSRHGDDLARAVLAHAFAGLGAALAPLLVRFEASIVVIGGSMAGSWDIVEPAVRLGLSETALDLGHVEVRPAERNQVAALLGAAFWSVSQQD